MTLKVRHKRRGGRTIITSGKEKTAFARAESNHERKPSMRREPRQYRVTRRTTIDMPTIVLISFITAWIVFILFATKLI